MEKIEKKELQKKFADFSRFAATQGAILLKNDNQILPLKPQETISVFGRTQINYYQSGTGSGGAVNIAYSTNLIDGLHHYPEIILNTELVDTYQEWIATHPFDNGGGGWAAEPWHQEEMPLSDVLVKKAREQSQKAIIVIGRTAGEDKDNEDTVGSYQLTEGELSMIRMVTNHFDKVCVVLNVTNIIDMNWVAQGYVHPIGAILYAWHGGMEGGNAVADVLTGAVNPSGKLTDTIAYALADYPSSPNYGSDTRNLYREDIYVGYRYFETFCPDKVQFPFGYGLSYTDFLIVLQPEMTYLQSDTVCIGLTVTNTGTNYAGKEVVQIYAEAPQGEIGKPSRELVAFAKTKLLEPGDSQQIAMEIPLKRLASYDDSGVTENQYCYVLEPGRYHFFAGNSIRNLEAVTFGDKDFLSLNELAIISRAEEAMAPTVAFSRMKPGKRKSDGTYELTEEKVPQRTIELSKRIGERLPVDYAVTGNQGWTLKDVDEKKCSMEEFVAQLEKEELAALVRGEGMGHPQVTPGTASAFGGVTDSLEAYKIPLACTADGPSGIRMESGCEAILLPGGTLLASSWDVELVEELFVLEGQELQLNQIDVLLGPGLNIHRNPLNGRNFEYFSEDSYLTGSMATAITKGIHKGGAEATLKHFACNNQEKKRSEVDSVLSERALREMYLRGFQMAIQEGGAVSIMTSYNPVNGHQAASNYDLNTTILRKEWGYQGIVMTDWWASMNSVEEGGPKFREDTRSMVRAQNDLYMVINNFGAAVNEGGDNTITALEEGNLSLGELQRCAINICRFLLHTDAFRRGQTKEAYKYYKALEKEVIESNILPYRTFADDLIYTQGESVLTFTMPEDGVYLLTADYTSFSPTLSQTTCNIYLNKELVTTIQVNGTDGRHITQKLLKIQLEKGFYELKFDYVQPGLQIEWIKFQKTVEN